MAKCQRCGNDSPIINEEYSIRDKMRVCSSCRSEICSRCVDWEYMSQLDTSLIVCKDCAKEGKLP